MRRHREGYSVVRTIVLRSDVAQSVTAVEETGRDDAYLAHELVKCHILRVMPPLLPLVRVVGRNRRVPNRSVELSPVDYQLLCSTSPTKGSKTYPNIHDLLSPLLAKLLRQPHAPLEIPRHAPALEPSLQPRVRERLSVRAPRSLLGCLGDPGGDLGLDLLELDVEVGGEALCRALAAGRAARVDELERGFVRCGAVLALVTTSALSI